MHSSLRLLAASSLALLLIAAARAETRPRYGGTVRMEMRASPQTLDPAATKDSGLAQIAPLLYDTLTTLDSSGRPVPSLASAWQQESEHRWRVILRPGVRFSDGAALTPAIVAESLHVANPDWDPHALGDAIVIESEQPLSNLPALLAVTRNAIVLRREGKLLGTGPFSVSDFQPGRRLTLAAVEDGWHERPFVDAIDIQFNRSPREQMLDAELNRAEVVEVAPDQLARLAQSGRAVVSSEPVDLLALRFNSTVRDSRVREAIALAIDRQSIVNVLLQRHGEPAAVLLPNWVTGYGFLFPGTPQLARARQLRNETKLADALTLVYGAADPLARFVAERVALNAGDAGITVKTLPSTQEVTIPDVTLLRVRLRSKDPGVALSELGRSDLLNLSVPDAAPASLPEVYRAELTALADHWAIPIAYVPAAYALGARVRNWTNNADGSWPLAEVWLVPEAK